ncbi:MAG TPA: iron ABC transporter permease, partial [Thermoleophilaceae bacterium]|nr:iron ABC transporter permease [Thermoleophilaceae bacterium]
GVGLRRRTDGWTAVTVLVAALVAGPLIGLPLSFVLAPGGLAEFSGYVPEALRDTAIVVAGVGAGTLLLGTGLALLVSFCDFPGRAWIEWALVLPLAVPGYVFTLFALGLELPGVRSPLGAVAVFTLVLYPYVYLLARASFLSQSRTLLEAARGLGLSRRRALARVGLPMARPAILGGVALALMEALADFGTVNLLGVRTFTDAIYRVWFGALDRDAAMQLATLLVSVTLTLLVLERFLRGRARYQQLAARGETVPPIRLRGLTAAAATCVPLALVSVVVLAPLAQLGVWSVRSIGDGLLPPEFAAAARNSVLLAAMSALLVAAVAVALAYGARATRSRAASLAARTATIGYGLPGSVVAVAVVVPLGWLDRRLDDAAGLFGADLGLLLTGTVIGLFAAYTVRFLALAFNAVEASLVRVPRELDEAARGLGADRLDVLARVHVPLLRTGLATAALLVFTEVMKELPATLLLRPLGGDTLAIAVWQATSESLFETAALPALLIVLVGLLPVVAMIRLSGRRMSELEAAQAAGSWAELEREEAVMKVGTPA